MSYRGESTTLAERVRDIERHLRMVSQVARVGSTKGGPSAYDIAVEEGYEGTPEEWLASLKGDPGAKKFSELTDVDLSTPPTDGQAPLWVATDGVWKPGNVGSGSGPAVPDPASGTPGDIIVVGPSSTYELSTPDPVVEDLDDLGDVSITAPSDAQVLTFDLASGTWKNVTPAGGSTGPALSNSDPLDLGVKVPGSSPDASRADHVHSMPTAAQVGALSTASNLSDLANTSTARVNLGLGTAATLSASDVSTSLPPRPLPLTAGAYAGMAFFVPGLAQQSNASPVATSGNRLNHELWTVDAPMTFIPSVEVGAAGAAGLGIRAWICRSDSNWQPTTLYHDFGFMLLDSGVGLKEWPNSYSIDRGYYVVQWVTNSGATLAAVRGTNTSTSIGAGYPGANATTQPSQGGSGSATVTTGPTLPLTGFVVGTANAHAPHYVKVRKV